MKTKICNKCNLEKHISKFSIHRSNIDGIRSICRVCANAYQNARRRTKDGLVSSIYSSQRGNAKKRGFCQPDYTNAQLKEWLFGQGLFHDLYDGWVESGYKRDKVPSCDRLDDYKGYTLDNLRIVTWHENQFRYFDDSKNGINNKQNKSILQYDKQGGFIKEYYSVSHAARVLCDRPITGRKNISMAAHGVNPSAYGYIWKFK